MATTPLTVQSKSYAALTPSFTALGSSGSGNGFTFANDGLTDFRIKNTNGSSATGTIKAAGSVGGVAIADQTFTIPATTGDVTLGNLSPAAFGSLVTIEVSSATGISAAALR